MSRRTRDLLQEVGSVAVEPFIASAFAAAGLADPHLSGLAVLAPWAVGFANYALAEMTSRKLSEREQLRFRRAAGFALARIQERLSGGDKPRNDEFFARDGGRSSAQELFEGVLVKSLGCYEERKVQYLGLLFANVVFDNTSAQTANWMLMLIEQMTYRQLCIVAVLSRGFPLREEPFTAGIMGMDDPRRKVYEDSALMTVLSETRWLLANGLALSHGSAFIDDLTTIAPSTLGLTFLGHMLARILDLDRIPDEDLAGVLEKLGVTRQNV